MRELDGARVAFLQTSAINESLGLCDLSGHLLAQGVATRLFLAHEERQLEDALRRYAPDLVVIPCDLLGHNQALSLAQRAHRAQSAPVVLGGTHPTFFPNVVTRPGVDYAFAGEAEGVVVDLLRAVRDGQDPGEIPNVIVRDGAGIRINPLRPLVTDLDQLAVPDRALYYRYPFIARFPWKKFATGRGCRNACSYCFNPSYRGLCGEPKEFFRRKSAARIVDEIGRVQKSYPLEIVHFSDDLFTSGTAWLADFVSAFKAQVGLPFSCNLFASSVTAEAVDLLQQGGCKVVSMGLEIADETLRRQVLNKPVSTAQIVDAAARLRSAGIHVVTFNIIGLPWSDLARDIATLALNQQLRSDHCRVSMLVPFPKSALTRRLRDQGFLSADFEERIYEVADLPAWPSAELLHRQDSARIERLYQVWHLALALGWPSWLTRAVVSSRWASVLRIPSAAISLWNEKKVFSLGWLEGGRYFWHVRNTAAKTTNYVSFI